MIWEEVTNTSVEDIRHSVSRAEVPGGWLYRLTSRVVEEQRCIGGGREERTVQLSVSLAFVPFSDVPLADEG